MYVIDFAKDGNSFFRVLSVTLHGNQDRHASLQVCITKYITEQAETALPADKAALLQSAVDIATDGVWAGDDLIRATVDCLQRSIQLFLPSEMCSPVIQSITSSYSTSAFTFAGFHGARSLRGRRICN